MLDQKVIELLNDQINKEFYSAYLYLDMANYYTANDLDGFANWYTVQAQEERDHAMLFLKYLQINGIPVELKAIDKPDKTFATHLDPLLAGAERKNEAAVEQNDQPDEGGKKIARGLGIFLLAKADREKYGSSGDRQKQKQ